MRNDALSRRQLEGKRLNRRQLRVATLGDKYRLSEYWLYRLLGFARWRMSPAELETMAADFATKPRNPIDAVVVPIGDLRPALRWLRPRKALGPLPRPVLVRRASRARRRASRPTPRSRAPDPDGDPEPGPSRPPRSGQRERERQR